MEDGEESDSPRSPSELAETVHREMYPDWVKDDDDIDFVKPEILFERPLLTQFNGWRKWCCRQDCGRQSVFYIEDSSSETESPERHGWALYCGSCGHKVLWEDVLFIHESWYDNQFGDEGELPWECWQIFRDVWLKPDWVESIGGLPTDDSVREVIRLSYYDQKERERKQREEMKENTDD